MPGVGKAAQRGVAEPPATPPLSMPSGIAAAAGAAAASGGSDALRSAAVRLGVMAVGYGLMSGMRG